MNCNDLRMPELHDHAYLYVSKRDFVWGVCVYRSFNFVVTSALLLIKMISDRLKGIVRILVLIVSLLKCINIGLINISYAFKTWLKILLEK